MHSRLKSPEAVLAALGELSKLETNAAKGDTLVQYVNAVSSLNGWLEAEGISVNEYDVEKF